MHSFPSRTDYAAFKPVGVEICLSAHYRDLDSQPQYREEKLKTLRGALALAKQACGEDEVLTGFNIEVQALNAEGNRLYLFERSYRYGRVVSIDEALASVETASPHPVLRAHKADALLNAKLNGAASHLYQTPPMEKCGAWFYANPGDVILDRRTDTPLLWMPRRAQVLKENALPSAHPLSDFTHLQTLSL